MYGERSLGKLKKSQIGEVEKNLAVIEIRDETLAQDKVYMKASLCCGSGSQWHLKTVKREREYKHFNLNF